jgi:hypothetical protein
MALLGAVLELKWFALKAFADVTVRPHPRQCLQYQSQALVAELQPRRICFLVGPPGGIACALRADTHKISWPGCAGAKTVFRAYRPAVGEPVFQVLVSLVGIRMCANPEHSRVARSTVHGLRERFPHGNRPRLPCTRGTKSTAANYRWENSIVAPFSGSPWLRREAQSSARRPVQTP